MIKRALVTNLGDEVYSVDLVNAPNQTLSFSALDSSFEITIRSYVSKLCFFTIKTAGNLLCVNNLGRLGVNLAYNPIITLDMNRHVFLLVAKVSGVYEVTYDTLSNLSLLYTQEPYYAKI